MRHFRLLNRPLPRVPARGTPTIHDATARSASDGVVGLGAAYIVGPTLAVGLGVVIGLGNTGLRKIGLQSRSGLAILCSLLLLSLLLLLFPGRAFAATVDTHVEGRGGAYIVGVPLAGTLARTGTLSLAGTLGPTLQLQVELDGTTKIGYWVPVQVQLSNEGAGFRGTLFVQAYSGPPGFSARITSVSSWSFTEPVTLPHGTQQQVSLSVPYELSPALPRGILATLRDQQGRTVTSQTSPVFTLKPGDLVFGLLSNEQTGFDQLNAVSLPNQFDSPTLTALDASTLPTSAAVLQNFDIIILDDFQSSTLSKAQLLALQAWVNQGGILIEVGGANWKSTLGSLPPALLPVIVNGSAALPAGMTLLPVGNNDPVQSGQKTPPTALQTTVPISTATLRSGGSTPGSETILSSSSTPLIVQARAGQGAIYYLAFDPASGAFPGWQSTGTLWRDLLFRALSDRLLISNTAGFYETGPAQLLARAGVLQMLYPDARLALWTIGLLLVSYLLVLGPVCILLLRNKKYTRWGWRVVVGSVVVFSLLSYGLASYERGTSLIDNSISIIQMDEGGSSAHITTYMGIFMPGAGDYSVHIPGNTLAQPVPDLLVTPDPFLSDSDPPSFITPTMKGTQSTTITLHQHESWTFQPIVAEQDRQLSGSISASLALRNNTLNGTLHNTLPTSLSDVYILLPHGFVSIGRLAAGSVQQISSAIQGGGSGLLADQIAASNGLSTPYFPYSKGTKPQGDFQRHMALLSALSGSGFTLPTCSTQCSQKAFINKQMVVTPNVIQPGTQPANGSDPLLVNGYTATLVGWANTPLDDQNQLGINGSTPQGFHDNLIEMQLNITFATPARIPPDYFTGQLIDAQGSDVQTILPSVYTATSGNLTFEFTQPPGLNLAGGTMVITVPNRLNSATKELSNTNNVQASLYNWQTGKWDTLNAASQNTFIVSNSPASSDSGGRILLRVSRQAASSAALILSRPWLSLKE